MEANPVPKYMKRSWISRFSDFRCHLLKGACIHAIRAILGLAEQPGSPLNSTMNRALCLQQLFGLFTNRAVLH
jgi:hypothetical protein